MTLDSAYLPRAGLILCAFLTLGARAAEAPADAVPKNPREWFEAGKAAVARNKATKSVDAKAKNVILFIGDGMGISTITAARILEGQLRGIDGEYNRLSFERFGYLAHSVTASANQQTSDSAPTATAIVSGVKANDLAISVDQTIAGDEADGNVTAAKSLRTILERAEERDMSTGIVTTARLTHATPAANYAHVANRDWEADRDLPRGASVKDIARQLIEFPIGNGIEVALGGGRSNFLPAAVADPEYPKQKGVRKDGRNFTTEWVRRWPRAAYVWNKAQFDAIDVARTDHLLGLFERSHMRYETDRRIDAAGEPSLTDMTAKAIALLSKNKNGYYLMVEGGRIDHGHHAGNAYRALTETIALSQAVAKARELTSDEDTLIIVTADHSHTLTIGGYPSRGNPILGKVDGEYGRDKMKLPYTTLSYANGPGWTGDGTRRELTPEEQNVPAKYEGSARRPDLSRVDTTHPGYMQEAAVPLNSETHGGEDVAIYGQGPGAYVLHGTLEQNAIYHVMAAALGWQ
jgi:alkaline phosphatase